METIMARDPRNTFLREHKIKVTDKFEILISNDFHLTFRIVDAVLQLRGVDTLPPSPRFDPKPLHFPEVYITGHKGQIVQ